MKVASIQNENKLRGTYKNNQYDYSQYRLPVLNDAKFATVNFKGQPNADKLSKIIKYGVHCMFCDKLVIDGKEFVGHIKSGAFNKSSKEVMEILSKYKNVLEKTQANVFNILEKYSKIFPDKTINEIIQLLKSSFERRLIQKQTPIFNQIKDKSKKLPSNYQLQLNLFMEETKNKVLGKPVKVPFSSYEFKYKLIQIKKYAIGTDNKSKAEVIDKLIALSEKFSNTTNKDTQPHQLKILKKIKKTIRQNNLQDDKKLSMMIDESFKRLYEQPMVMKFSKKAFMYDLYKILADCNNKKLTQEILAIGEKLPTSLQSTSAYIMKYSDQPTEKLFYDLFEQYFFSADHLLAHSKGGKSKLSNYGAAHRKCNTLKGSEYLYTCIDKKPQIKQYTQKSFEDMVRINNEGLFKENNVPTRYLYNFAKTVFNQSGKHKLKLDTSQISTHFTPKLSTRIQDILKNVKYLLKRLNFYIKSAD